MHLSIVPGLFIPVSLLNGGYSRTNPINEHGKICHRICQYIWQYLLIYSCKVCPFSFYHTISNTIIRKLLSNQFLWGIRLIILILTRCSLYLFTHPPPPLPHPSTPPPPLHPTWDLNFVTTVPSNSTRRGQPINLYNADRKGEHSYKFFIYEIFGLNFYWSQIFKIANGSRVIYYHIIS